MEAQLIFDIVCGEQTCAESPGKFCSFIRTNIRGDEFCFLYGSLLYESGEPQRHKACLALATEKKQSVGCAPCYTPTCLNMNGDGNIDKTKPPTGGSGVKGIKSGRKRK